MTAAAPARFRAAILTVSDSAAAGRREDLSGPAAEPLVEAQGCDIVAREIVPDDRDAIAERLRHFADVQGVTLIVTTGGTGFAPRDVTPEATRDVIDREAPGLAEAMRRITSAETPLAVLSRGVAGLRGRTLILNLPGSPRAVRQCLEALTPALRHGLMVLAGAIRSHDGETPSP